MPILVTGNSSVASRRERGFTLLELMVVVTIIGIASASVILAMPDPGARVVDEAERFAARALAVRDDAIIQGRDMSIWVSREGYGVEQRRRGAWQRAAGRSFAGGSWPEGTSAVVGGAGRDRVVFDTTGAVSAPATITLQRGEAEARVAISADGSIRVGG